MSDILFRYLLMARRRELSFWRRLFVRDDRLLEAGVEQLVESASARVDVRSQHERESTESVEEPLSRQHRYTFHDVVVPNPPTPGRFEERRDEFPLRATLREFTCPDCHGRGEVKCSRCRGRGRVNCGNCSGSGRVNDGAKTYTCGNCNGSGTRSCSSCHGSGWRTCNRCRGEGQLASWDTRVFDYLIEDRADESYPHEDHRLRRAFKKWLKIDTDHVESFAPEDVAAHLGYSTPEALGVAAHADDHRQRLETEARGSTDRYLFHQTTCAITPTGYTVVRTGGTARYYWLVGRGDEAQEIRPRSRADGRKLLGWMGVGSGSLLSWEAAIRVAEVATSTVLDPLQIFLGIPEPLLAGSALASGLMAISGVRRVYDRPRPVTTLGLLPASGRPTPWLTCLAYLGSYSERLIVLDRAYDTQLERLLGKMRPARQSESLTVEMLGGRRIRLIELARPSTLSDGQLDYALRALDGVMILDDDSRATDELDERLRQVATAEEDVTPIHRVVIDGIGLPPPPPPPPGGRQEAAVRGTAAASTEIVPIEEIRRSFVEDVAGGKDWDASFDRLWRPLDRLLIAVDAVVPGL